MATTILRTTPTDAVTAVPIETIAAKVITSAPVDRSAEIDDVTTTLATKGRVMLVADTTTRATETVEENVLATTAVGSNVDAKEIVAENVLVIPTVAATVDEVAIKTDSGRVAESAPESEDAMVTVAAKVTCPWIARFAVRVEAEEMTATSRRETATAGDKIEDVETAAAMPRSIAAAPEAADGI